jgi:hypothetical protein
MTLAELLDLGTPVIVPVRIYGLDHFVVVRGAIGGRVVVADPAFGNLTFSANRFEQFWKAGIAFVVLSDGEASADPLAAEVSTLRVPDLPSVARRLRGAGPAPLTRGRPAVP